MAREHKRKRSVTEADDHDQPAVKVQVSETDQPEASKQKPQKKSGEERQKRSEKRKKAKALAKQQERMAKNMKSAATAGGVTGGLKSSDSLAAGQDFVPLTDVSMEGHKPKRVSPRSIRAQAKRQKFAQEMTGDEAAADAKTGDTTASPRFICFVGNLPYSVTTEQIATHFSKLQPKSIRLNTDKKTGKSKGFAFLEFEDYDKMKTCLKLYHHSIFDPDQVGDTTGDAHNSNGNTKTNVRKINVELTAGGGGGKSTGRRDKITAKNKKLNEERTRDWEKKRQEEAKKPMGSRSQRDRQVKSGPNAEDVNPSFDGGRGAIHPSRLNRVGF